MPSPLPRLSLQLPLLVLLWYSCNTLAAYLTKQAFHDNKAGRTPDEVSSSFLPGFILVLFVSFLQLAFSGILGIIYVQLGGFKSDPWKDYLAASKRDPRFFRLMTSIGICNAVGCVATNVGYLHGSVTLVQLIKTMEPVITFFADIFVLKTTHTVTTASGVLLVLVGASYASYQDPTFNLICVLAACISNAFLPLRNILTRSYHVSSTQGKGRLHRDHPTGFVLFALVSTIGAGIVAIVLLGMLLVVNATTKLSPWSVLSALAYAGFNSFSFLVLHQVDPVLHAILNVMKRAFVIMTSMLLFQQTPSLRFWLGLTVTITGLFVYLIGKKKIDIGLMQKIKIQYGTLSLVLLLFGVSKWLSLVQVQQIAEEGRLLHGTVPAVIPMVDSLMEKNIVMVPLEAYNTCGDRILHMSCLRTIVATNSAIPVAPSLYPQLCDDLVESAQLEGSDWQVDDAHCMLCLQVNGMVGALVEVSNKAETGVVKRINRYLIPSESDSIAAILSHGMVQRVVDRKSIVMRQWYQPFSAKNNGDREWRERDSNRGNFIWQYGATRMINPFTTLFVYDASEAASAVSALVLAEANALNLDNPEWSQEVFPFLLSLQRRLNVPTIMLGIGIQLEFSSDSNSLRMFDFQRDFFLDLEKRQKHPAIGVRGNLTRMACENSGIRHCVTMGCPSLTINTERNLGALLEQRWKNLVSKLGRKEKVKLVLVLPKRQTSGLDKILQLFLRLAQIHECVTILQVKHDFVLLQESGLEKHTRNVTFSNVEEWFEWTGSVDLVLTARIHGGMAGIARATPMILIPTDLRIQELANTMLLPQLPMQYVEQGGTTDLFTLMQKVQPDFAAFEKNRRTLLSKWSGILNEAGIEMNPTLLEIVQESMISQSYL